MIYITPNRGTFMTEPTNKYVWTVNWLESHLGQSLQISMCGSDQLVRSR